MTPQELDELERLAKAALPPPLSSDASYHEQTKWLVDRQRAINGLRDAAAPVRILELTTQFRWVESLRADKASLRAVAEAAQAYFATRNATNLNEDLTEWAQRIGREYIALRDAVPRC